LETSLATGEKSPWNYGLELLVPHTTAWWHSSSKTKKLFIQLVTGH